MVRAMQLPDAPTPIRQASMVLRLTAHIARQNKALARAVKAVPKPVPWDWAAPRLMPLLAGPRFDDPAMPLVRHPSGIGPIAEFGLDLGSLFLMVDRPVAERWECTSAQLMERGLRNLRERAAKLRPEQAVTGVMSGRPIRILQDRPIWASSLLMDLESLTRLFGPHDQLLAAPTTKCLVSLPAGTPWPIAAEIVVDLEASSFEPLFLDPFALENGELVWGGDARDDDDLEDWTS